MQTQNNRAMQKRQTFDVVSVRRNPYLVDYEEQKKLRTAVNEGSRRSAAAVNGRRQRSAAAGSEGSRRPAAAGNERSRRSAAVGNERSRRSAARNERNRKSVDIIEIDRRRTAETAGRHPATRTTARTAPGRQSYAVSANRRRNPAAAKRAAEKRRRRQVLRRRIAVGAWTLCIFMAGWLFLLKKGNASETDQNNAMQESQQAEEESRGTFFGTVQGLPADKYMEHPEWTEDFLPLNEYSRPGENLSEVKDIFVHYTANPRTSAAQNHSYFEQQKDMHEASVSAHFIIGYNGEILQCVPLDEIAYAVQTRNYDSVSIECCYKAENGSFTQETYDSLISLLAWLTDAYDLDTSHILRHYDCGGKKCPLYYTENEDAWERLKKDVAAEKEG